MPGCLLVFRRFCLRSKTLMMYLVAMSQKTTPPDMESQIVRLRAQGETVRAIAEHLSLSKGAVQRVLDRARVPAQPVQRHAGVGTGTRLKAKMIYLPEDLAAWIQREASERGVSESEFVRQALAAYRER